MTWHNVSRINENVYLISEPLGAIEPRYGVLRANMYLVIGEEYAALIDSGMGIGNVRAEIREITSLPCLVLNTHYHWDHTGANFLFDERAIHEYEADLIEQEQDIIFLRDVMQSPQARAVLPSSFDSTAYRYVAKPATRVLQDNELIDLGDCILKVLHTPGHSPGHVAYFSGSNGMLFTGDAAYLGHVYACFEGSDHIAFSRSVERLAALEDVETICPGHNDIISNENWLREFAECVEAAITGKVEGQLRDDFIVGREFRFGNSSVWLPK